MSVRFFRFQLEVLADRLLAFGQGSTFAELSTETLAATDVVVPPLLAQRAIADFLDQEAGRIDRLIATKRKIVDLLNERVDAAIRILIGESALANGTGPVAPIRRVLEKRSRFPAGFGEMITAYRDGQVTARSARRPEGYTEAATDTPNLQGVHLDDVVIHGLDGFAGAIGCAEVSGVCSPVYHVCTLVAGGNAIFWGRMLRVLATTGYLGLFATSTRERAVDLRNWDLVRRIPVPIVALHEQERVGRDILAIRPLQVAVERSIGLARERRRALILAAVAGEIDLPGAAA